MAKKNELAKMFGVAVPLAAVALLVKVVADGSQAKTYAPGEVVASGERKVGVNEMVYEWRVVGSSPGQADPLTGQAKAAGFGSWDVESIVAMGADKGTTMANIFSYLDGLA